MKKIMLLVVVTIALACFAQNTGDYPEGIRIMFADGSTIRFDCHSDGNCFQKENTSTVVVTQLNMGFSNKRAYILHIH
jgi:hypothetical protein